MKNSFRLATTVALIAMLGGTFAMPAMSADFSGILQSLSRGVRNWSELEARQNEITVQLGSAVGSGQLTVIEADGFKAELNRVAQVATQIKAFGRPLGATDSVSFTNSLNNLTTRINIAIVSQGTASSVGLTAIDAQRAQLNAQVDTARAAHTLTQADAESLRRDLTHNADIQRAFLSGTNGVVSDAQATVLTTDLARIKVLVDQRTSIIQSGSPQLASQRAALEQQIVKGLANQTIRPSQASEFRQELSRIAQMQTNFTGYDGVLTNNEVLTIASELDRLSGRIDYQTSIAAGPYDRDGQNRWGYGSGNSRYNNVNNAGHGFGANRNRERFGRDVDARQAELLARINAAQANRQLGRIDSTHLREELARIASTEARLKATRGGRLSATQSASLWDDLAEVEATLKEQISARSTRRSSYR